MISWEQRFSVGCSNLSYIYLTNIKDNEHFPLHRPRFAVQRRDLLDFVSGLPDVRIMRRS